MRICLQHAGQILSRNGSETVSSVNKINQSRTCLMCAQNLKQQLRKTQSNAEDQKLKKNEQQTN